jgi:hypothetical protein
MIPEVIHQRLSNDASITALLATYDFGNPSPDPAIFTMEHGIPDDAEFPAIHIVEVSPGTEFGSKGNRGLEIFADVTVYGDKDTDSDMEALGILIWKRLDRARLDHLLAPYGFEHWIFTADAPLKTSSPGGFPGYTIRTRIKVLEI